MSLRPSPASSAAPVSVTKTAEQRPTILLTMEPPQNTQESQSSSTPASSYVSDSQHTPVPASYSSDAPLADHATTPPSSQSLPRESLLGTPSMTSVVESNLRTRPARPSTPQADVSPWQNRVAGDNSVQDRKDSESPVHGTKRMASGSIKPTTPAIPAATRDERFRGHSRKISMDSAASNISELSSQLKARLSYAMVKVQNGWENRSINEVESLASQLASPTSTTSTPRLPRLPPQSPRDVMANMNRRSRDLSLALTQSQNTTLAHDQRGVGRAPEPLAQYAPAPRPGSGGPSLAPAAVITSEPTHRRRRTSTIGSYMPPALATSRLPNNTLSHSVPVSPRGAHRTATPTPQEQDAVDTLLFMSSPANSAHYQRQGHNAHLSPLRSEFSAPASRGKHQLNGMATAAPRRLVNGASGSSDEGSVVQASPIQRGSETSLERDAKRRSIAAGQMQTEFDVERLLDEMADGQSSDEEVRVVLTPVPVGDAQSVHVRM